ncbi:hypothetical protein Q5741_09550 [Paenibacillus sp. JX-17]|uniref:Lipoprotein n=1 Tax=Paenibacillus lacisoli TaxID=3064525 RepID=A0ABT9CBM5_9BACL|nr:hypothetical protein [Paenibacillus sp. JX-17]MDO7906665.1 hypothetical protein [Paenibacillus sp. JX-17]
MEERESVKKPDPGRRAKMMAFAVMLAVPAVLTGCGSKDECDPQVDNSCEYMGSSGGGGGYYHYTGSGYSSKGYNSSGAKSSGFGSGGSHSGFFSGG